MDFDDRPRTAAVVLTSASTLLDELKKDVNLNEFIAAFQEAFDTLRGAVANDAVQREQAQSTGKQLDELRQQLSLVRSEEDELSSTALALQEDCSKLRAAVGKAQINSANAEASTRDLRSKVEALRAQLELGSDWRPDQRERQHGLESQRMSLLADLEGHRAVLMGLRSEVAAMTDAVDAVQARKNDSDNALSDCHDEIAAAKNAISAATRAKASADSDLRASQTALGGLKVVLKEREAQAETARVGAAGAQDALRQEKAALDASAKEEAKLKARAVKLRDDAELQQSANATLQADVSAIAAKTATLGSDAARAIEEEDRLSALLELVNEKIGQAEQRRLDVEAARSAAIRTQQEVDEELNATRRAKEAKQALISAAKRERDVARKVLSKTGDKTKEVTEAIEAAAANRDTVLSDIAEHQQAMLRLRGQITELKGAKAEAKQQCEAAAQAYFTAVESLKLQELQHAALGRKLEEGKARLKQQQSLYDAAKMDRNTYSKRVTEAQQEINDLKRKYRGQKIAIDKLKDDITVKDQDLVKEHFEHHKVSRAAAAAAAAAGISDEILSVVVVVTYNLLFTIRRHSSSHHCHS